MFGDFLLGLISAPLDLVDAFFITYFNSSLQAFFDAFLNSGLSGIWNILSDFMIP